jgi:hypothetical protein
MPTTLKGGAPVGDRRLMWWAVVFSGCGWSGRGQGDPDGLRLGLIAWIPPGSGTYGPTTDSHPETCQRGCAWQRAVAERTGRNPQGEMSF